jgi:Protein of unknown function (DUF2758).
MKIKVFDEENETDLEDKVNKFLEDLDEELIDIKYQVSFATYGEEQLYCFSAMIVYKE